MALRRILAALSLLPLVACSAKGPAAAGNNPANPADRPADSAASPAPPIHYDQTSVLTMDGQPKEEESYRKLLADCQKAGAALHALTPEDMAKVGRVHLEAWIGPDKQARHQEEWHLDAPGPCQFALSHVDQTEIDDANGRATTIDGVTHKVDVQELGKPTPVAPLPPEDGEMNEGARQAGWTKQGLATSNGAQCAVWQSSTGFQLCVWTGGRQWGYSADGMTALKDGVSRGDSIVLWTRPGQGAAWKLETKEFSVGQALDSRAFALPANTAQGASP
jgi:hypothetical protein